MTEIVVFSETAAVEWQADALWHICASGQLVSISSLPDRNCSKQSHYTTLQGLPLYLCNGFCFSLLHDLGLLVTFQNLLSSLQTRRDVPSNLFFSFTVPILFQKTFMHLKAVIMLPLDLCFSLWTTTVHLIFPYWLWIMLFALHQTFSNHSTCFWIQGLKIWFRP